MGHKSDDTEIKLIGYGFGGVLVFGIVLGFELFNGSPPSITSLQPFSGQLVELHISQDRSRIFADIRVKNGTQDVILFQQVSKKLCSDIQKLPSGMPVTALIVPRDFVDSRTGLIRHSMWQLAINEQEMFSYEEITQFINKQTTRWRIFAYWSGALAIACFIERGLEGCGMYAPNPALNLAPFGRWTLRDKAAQRRLALLQGLPHSLQAF